MSDFIVGRPKGDEHADYAAGYIGRVESDDIIGYLDEQLGSLMEDLRLVPESKYDFRYSEGKWTVKEVLGHIIDTERVMSFRAFVFARSDKQEYPGMDQDVYADNSDYASREWADIVEEFRLLRSANLHLFRGFADEDWMKRGIASDSEVSVRALAYLMAGHVEHHLGIVQERYHA